MLEKLLESVRHYIRGVARDNHIGSMGARFDTSDIIQEAMIQVWKELDSDSLGDKEISKAWLVSVAKGHAYKLARFHSAQKRSHVRDEAFVDQVPTENRKPDDAIADLELQLSILVALDELPDDEKDIVVLYFFEQQSLSSIAKKLNLSLDKVRTRHSRALKALHKKLGQVEGLHE